MEFLGRRFSQVIDITQARNFSSEDIQAARDILQSRWSSDTISTLDDSEIRTAPYVPTPNPHPENGLVSNYPLFSVTETNNPRSHSPETEESYPSSPPSPRMQPRLARPSHTVSILTPPPPLQPARMLQQRSRPVIERSNTTADYQFPSRPPSGMTRPSLNRSISAPFFSSADRDRPYAQALLLRAAGTFPIARPIPGESRLRESTRRESIMSYMTEDSPMMSRRSSMVPERRNSISSMTSADRRFSPDFGDGMVMQAQAGVRTRQSLSSKGDGLRRPLVPSSLPPIEDGRALTRQSHDSGSKSQQEYASLLWHL